MFKSVFTVGKFKNSPEKSYRRASLSLHVWRLQKSFFKQFWQSKTPENSLRYGKEFSLLFSFFCGKGIFEDWLQKFSLNCQRFFPFVSLCFSGFFPFTFWTLSVESALFYCLLFSRSLEFTIAMKSLFHFTFHQFQRSHSNIFLSFFPISDHMLVNSQAAKSATLTRRLSASTSKITTSKVAENHTESHRAINSRP